MHPLSHVDTVMDNGVLSWFSKKLDIDVGNTNIFSNTSEVVSELKTL